jgi:hypothetical protein
LRVPIIARLATIALVSLIASGTSTVTAQDGTSGAAPLEETDCVLVPASSMDRLRGGTPDLATPVGNPATDLTGATPSSAATPIAATAAIEASSDPLLEDLTAASTSLTSCLTEGRAQEVAAHTSATFRGQLIGSPSALGTEDFSALFETLPQVEYHVLEIANVQLDEENTASADVVWQIAHQVRVDRWAFARERVNGLVVWTVQRADPGSVTPSLDFQQVDVTIESNRYALATDAIEGDAVMFDVSNTDNVAHELLILRFESGVTTESLLRTPGPELPDGVAMIGQASIAPNGEGGLLLSDLEPGTYTIVCLLLNDNGVPHLSDGMEATFTVQS